MCDRTHMTNLRKTNKKVVEFGFWFLNLGIFAFSSQFAFADPGPQGVGGGPAVPAGSNPMAVGVGQQPNGLMAFVPFILMFGVLYLLVLRPQQKKIREQQDMIAALKQGDEVITASGILGKVRGITEKLVTLEIADNVKVRVLKSQISQVLKGSLKDLDKDVEASA